MYRRCAPAVLSRLEAHCRDTQRELQAARAQAQQNCDVTYVRQVSTRILGRRTAPFTTFPYFYLRPAWFYPRS